MGIGLLGFAFVTNPVLIVVFRIINGIGFAFSGTCQIALASKYIPKNKMGEGIGYLGLGMVIGSAVAPWIGVTISENFGMSFFAVFRPPLKPNKTDNCIYKIQRNRKLTRNSLKATENWW